MIVAKDSAPPTRNWHCERNNGYGNSFKIRFVNWDVVVETAYHKKHKMRVFMEIEGAIELCVVCGC